MTDIYKQIFEKNRFFLKKPRLGDFCLYHTQSVNEMVMKREKVLKFKEIGNRKSGAKYSLLFPISNFRFPLLF